MKKKTIIKAAAYIISVLLVLSYLYILWQGMHPENISDVRRFQKKIQESGMNEDARKEAEKVLNRMKQEG